MDTCLRPGSTWALGAGPTRPLPSRAPLVGETEADVTVTSQGPDPVVGLRVTRKGLGARHLWRWGGHEGSPLSGRQARGSGLSSEVLSQRRSLCRTQSSRGGMREGEARGQVGGQGLGTCGQGAHLSCRSKAAVRQGRSSSAWSISTAVEASSRAGRSPTNSAVRGGLFQARNCGGGGTWAAQRDLWLGAATAQAGSRP